MTNSLLHPTRVALGPGGEIYVAQRGGPDDPPGTGEVVRIDF